ncbi:TolC family protein [Desertibacillus haloalkaliphilus]|uniref:TolC family protein n=1 Tax=Desertibacillus haloalkaliphilus TaxID=1328930 RepID=UPI001C253D8E|nr:TolC family protein [Desertibacillus haloalkaliphilus]MBU8905957.1 TolC family protein [Desertibacillus haloalkaliphilus]
MKKLATIALGTSLCFSSMQLTTLADGIDDQILDEEIQEVDGEQEGMDGEEVNEEVEEELLEEVTSLSLEDVIERGLENNSMLLLLRYEQERLENQDGQTRKDLRDAKNDIDDAEDAWDNLNEMRRMLNRLYTEDREGFQSTHGDFGESRQELHQQREGIENQLEQLEDLIDQLELGLEQIESGQIQLNYQKEEAELMMKLMLTADYVELVSLADQIAFLENSLKLLQNDIERTNRQYQLGLVSRDELSKLYRDEESQDVELEQLKKDYQNKLARLTLDIGVMYNPEIKLEPIPVNEVEAIERDEDIDELIEQSYEMKKAEEHLRLAKIEREDVYEDEDASQYQRNQADIDVDIEIGNVEETQVELTQAINELYFNLDEAVQSVKDAERELNYTIEDHEKLKLQHQLGLISTFDVNQASFQIEQAQFELEMSKVSYFMVAEQVKAMEEGLIQVNS